MSHKELLKTLGLQTTGQLLEKYDMKSLKGISCLLLSTQLKFGDGCVGAEESNAQSSSTSQSARILLGEGTTALSLIVSN